MFYLHIFSHFTELPKMTNKMKGFIIGQTPQNTCGTGLLYDVEFQSFAHYIIDQYIALVHTTIV